MMAPKSKHVWTFEAEETSSGTMFSVYDEDDWRITEMSIREDQARLTAAAPELLAALEQCVERLVGDLEEIRHLRRFMSDSERDERATQDEAADNRDEEVIARCRAVVHRAKGGT